MIARLAGIIVEVIDNTVILDCNGVGYEVVVSTQTLASVDQVPMPAILRIFTHAQENKIALYGFFTREERELFDLLITVKNVGPSSAMKILSARPCLEIGQLIASAQVNGLTALKGMGKKTAELLVVELREKCQVMLATWAAQGRAPDSDLTMSRPKMVVATGPLADVSSALLQMGFKSMEIDKVLATLEPAAHDTVETLLRQALRGFSRER